MELAFLILIFGLFSKTEAYLNASDVPLLDPKVFENYKENVCNALGSFQTLAKHTNFKAEITEEEILELAFFSIMSQSNPNNDMKFPQENNYRKKILNVISKIVKSSCPQIVNGKFLNSGINLFLYYISKLNVTTTPENSDFPKSWSEIGILLEQCAKHSENVPIVLQKHCGMALDLNQDENRDEIIETIWSMFSITFGRCFGIYYPRAEWLLQFEAFFIEQFLQPFLKRWKNPGPIAKHFPIVFGPFDFQYEKNNLKICSKAVYEFAEGLSEPILRPFLNYDDEKMNDI